MKKKIKRTTWIKWWRHVRSTASIYLNGRKRQTCVVTIKPSTPVHLLFSVNFNWVVSDFYKCCQSSFSLSPMHQLKHTHKCRSTCQHVLGKHCLETYHSTNLHIVTHRTTNTKTSNLKRTPIRPKKSSFNAFIL